MTYEFLKTEQMDQTLVVTVSRPSALNALNSSVLKELDALLDAVKDDASVYSLVLTGDGKAFVAGARCV